MSLNGSADEVLSFQTRIFQVVTQLIAAITFVLAFQLNTVVAVVVAMFLALIFYFSKSVLNGLFNIFLSAAITSVVCSVSHALRIDLGVPNFVLLVFAFFCLALPILNSRVLGVPTLSKLQFEFCLTLVLLITTLFLRQLTHLDDVRLFAMLLPEDNASWIGASNGFIRFNSTVGNLASTENGSKYFLALIISVISKITSLGSSNGQPEDSLVSIANTYSFLILLLMAFVSAIAFQVFHVSRHTILRLGILKPGKFALLGLIVVVSVGKVFLNAGHLSLICGAFAICATSFGFMATAADDNGSGGINSFWKLNLAFISSFAIGNAWLPLISVAVATMLLSLMFAFKAKFFIPALVQKTRLRLMYVANLFLFLLVFLAAFQTLRIPSGYSVSNLILTSPGGTIIPTAITLSASIFGFISLVNVLGTNNFNSFFLPLLPLGLLSLWLFSLNSLPEQPGYSVEKFSMLVAIVGLPFLVGSIMSTYDNHPASPVAFGLAPLLLTFAVLIGTWGINSFPRTALLDKDNPTLNFLPELLTQSKLHPDAHILCLGTSPAGDMPAYTCSRFGSALQFREFGSDDLARRWRSQILGISVDKKNILETKNFVDIGLVNKFIDAGGELIVLLIPGPKFLLDNRTDQPWIHDLPWEKISVVQ